MLQISLEASNKRVYFPGSLVEGAITASLRSELSNVSLTLVGVLNFETRQTGYTANNTPRKKTYQFIDDKVQLSPISEANTRRVRQPFTVHLPTAVDWYSVDRSSPEPLAWPDISLIPTALPPTIGIPGSDSPVHISYHLEARQSGQHGRVVRQTLYVCPLRRDSAPYPQWKTQAERFQLPQQHVSRGFINRLPGAMHSPTAATSHVEIAFHLPQVVTVGGVIEIRVELRERGLLAGGAPAPVVAIERLRVNLSSHTKIDVGMEFVPKGRGVDTAVQPTVFDGRVESFTTALAVKLPAGETVIIGRSGPSFTVHKGLSPSFQTMGLGRSYSIEVSGEARIASVKSQFVLKKQFVNVLPAWSVEQQMPVNVSSGESPPDIPPPAYNEVVAADLALHM